MLDAEARRSTGLLVKRIDPHTVPLLREELKSPMRTRRLRGLAIAQAVEAVEALEPLVIELLEDEDHMVRVEAATTLGLATSLASRGASAGAGRLVRGRPRGRPSQPPNAKREPLLMNAVPWILLAQHSRPGNPGAAGQQQGVVLGFSIIAAVIAGTGYCTTVGPARAASLPESAAAVSESLPCPSALLVPAVAAVEGCAGPRACEPCNRVPRAGTFREGHAWAGAPPEGPADRADPGPAVCGAAPREGPCVRPDGNPTRRWFATGPCPAARCRSVRKALAAARAPSYARYSAVAGLVAGGPGEIGLCQRWFDGGVARPERAWRVA